MVHTAVVYAARCIVRILKNERRENDIWMRRWRMFELEFRSKIDQISEMIDKMAGRGRGSEEDFTLSMLLDAELGYGWVWMLVQQVNDILQFHPSFSTYT